MKRPVWVLKAAVLAFHAECLRLHGGSAGIRDEGLLESALARPKHLARRRTNRRAGMNDAIDV